MITNLYNIYFIFILFQFSIIYAQIECKILSRKISVNNHFRLSLCTESKRVTNEIWNPWASFFPQSVTLKPCDRPTPWGDLKACLQNPNHPQHSYNLLQENILRRQNVYNYPRKWLLTTRQVWCQKLFNFASSTIQVLSY